MEASLLKAVVISTGTEITAGDIVDTNSQLITKMLAECGIKVVFQLACSDNAEDLKKILIFASQQADLLVMSGGLGPTEDDLTVDVVCDLLACQKRSDEKALLKIKKILCAKRSPEKSQSDYKMALIPEKSDVLENIVGYAPGFAVKNAEKLLIALPGVPRELKKMLPQSVKPYLDNHFELFEPEQEVFAVVGIREADVNDQVVNLDLNFLSFEWGITAALGYNKLTFREKKGISFPRKEIKKAMQEQFGKAILQTKDLNFFTELVRLLKNKGKTLAAAESCTGGLLAASLTEVAGASDVFLGGAVTYTNEIKEKLISVQQDTLLKYGAVSVECAKEMAEGVLRATESDYAVSITGLAGPGGGTENLPVGTVCFGLADGNCVKVYKEHFNGNRQAVRVKSVYFILEKLREYLN